MEGLGTVRTLPDAAMVSAFHLWSLICHDPMTHAQSDSWATLHVLGGMLMRFPYALALKAHWTGWLVLMEGGMAWEWGEGHSYSFLL